MGDNLNRVRIVQVVSLIPGVHLRQLQRILDVSFSTVRYHVTRLSRTGELVCNTEGGFSRLYPVGMEQDARPHSHVRLNRASRKILSALLQRGAISNKDLAEATRLAKSTVSANVHNLINRGVVRRTVYDEGRMGYVLTDSVATGELLESSDAGALESVVTNYIDLWDF
ncbi:MAG: winged helix-turn-helix transcriptional regulator [Thaumarchaeota archaeon]|nr:winged helix-turn-helix transcriptional regulator [Nitrososphaerota archaeon]